MKILLNPGHTAKSKGACRGALQEYACNEYQAQVLQSHLVAAGVQADIRHGDDLFKIGLASKGYDAFISLHLNAHNRAANYTCCCIGYRSYSRRDDNALVASKCASAMGTALNLKLFDQHASLPGVRTARLEVLSGAAVAKCPVAFLTEAFFLDCYTDNNLVYNLIEVAMLALHNSLLGELL